MSTHVSNLRLTRERIMQDQLYAEAHPNGIKVWITEYNDDESSFMILGEEGVRDLYAFLGEWLDGQKVEGSEDA